MHATHAFVVHASSYHLHRQNGVQRLANSALSAFPTKKNKKKTAGGQVTVALKMKSEMHIPENFMVTVGGFECNTCHVMGAMLVIVLSSLSTFIFMFHIFFAISEH